MMSSKDILNQYSQIEYQATTDNQWYKLSDLYPFAFPLKDSSDVVVFDTGGERGDFVHCKISDGKLFKQDFVTSKWKAITDVRINDGLEKANPMPGIVAVEEPFYAHL